MISHRKIINKLIKQNISISVAESCTGGLLSSSFTSQSGVSKIFNMGLITYSNKAKIDLLKISPTFLKKYGAVSEETAGKMSINLYKKTKSRMVISTTGIAGPLGGSVKKPVGLVFISIKYKKNMQIIKKKFKGSRIQIQKKTIITIFNEINKLI
tara:strand:- start:3158 stop:3622 length:465 start_codon:yes stop_codon:yes gene_type:complete